MVDHDGGRPDSSGVPTIAELLTAYRDRSGSSYVEMARKVGDELLPARIHQLASAPPKEFPKRTSTVEALAALLEVTPATIVLAFAAGLGIPVQASAPLLAQNLPPGTDKLTDDDQDAILRVVRQMVRARRDAQPIDSPEPATAHDYSLAARRGTSEGRRLRAEQDLDAES